MQSCSRCAPPPPFFCLRLHTLSAALSTRVGHVYVCGAQVLDSLSPEELQARRDASRASRAKKDEQKRALEEHKAASLTSPWTIIIDCGLSHLMVCITHCLLVRNAHLTMMLSVPSI